MSAGERREEILNAAVVEFARKGLHGTSTEEIARRVGISQPYLFRLYHTKKALFLAAVERNFDSVLQAFRTAAEGNPANRLLAMGRAYREMLDRRDDLLLQMQAYVACSDPEICTVVRGRFAHLYSEVEALSEATPEEVRDFFAVGMLLNVAAAMDLMSLSNAEDWAHHRLQM
jgi:AcrR family transcriptional regulator